MNRPLVLTSVALGAVMALTGCGEKKKATTVAESPTAGRTPGPARPPVATATVGGTVKIGGVCKATGTVGKTAGGTWARCLKRPGDARPRWYSQAPSPGTRGARAGQFCSPAGSTSTSASGTKLVCKKKAGEP